MNKLSSQIFVLVVLIFVMLSTACDENNNMIEPPLLGDPVECPCFSEQEVKDEVDSFDPEFRACESGTGELTIALPDDNNFTVICKDFEFNTPGCFCDKNQQNQMNTAAQMTLSEDEYDSCTKILEDVINDNFLMCIPAEE